MAVLVIDSGLGGISVVRALRQLAPRMRLHYLADNAWFPYGSRSAEALMIRAERVVRASIEIIKPDVIVLACNTLSTLCLTSLRAGFDVPFVGTVPAIKVAASLSKTRRFTLLATPNTAASNYSADLISAFAADCTVDRYGAPNLAAMAESALLGRAMNDAALRAEIAPCFFDDARGKTDAVVLGCTHYPLIADDLARCAPWSVTWIDASFAIARQALSVTHDHAHAGDGCLAYVTAPDHEAHYEQAFKAEGFSDIRMMPVP